MCDVDADTFQQIFRDHWDAFKTRYPTFDTPDYNMAVRKMLDCGDPEKMGYVQYRCLFCGETRRIAFTCKSCFCLSGAQPRMAQWSNFIGRRLLPGVTYPADRTGRMPCTALPRMRRRVPPGPLRARTRVVHAARTWLSMGCRADGRGNSVQSA